jgi:hypothetical protein
MEQTKPKATVDDEELLELKPAGPLDAEEEKNLAEFLKKVALACQNDNTVPSEVGAQVSSWLKEMEEEDSNDLKADCGGS